MLIDDARTGAVSARETEPISGTTGGVWELISGDDSVRYPAWELWVESGGRTGFLEVLR